MGRCPMSCWARWARFLAQVTHFKINDLKGALPPMIQNSCRVCARVSWAPPWSVVKWECRMISHVSWLFRGIIAGRFEWWSSWVLWSQPPTLMIPNESMYAVNMLSTWFRGTCNFFSIMSSEWRWTRWVSVLQKSLALLIKSAVRIDLWWVLSYYLNRLHANITHPVIRNNWVSDEYCDMRSHVVLKCIVAAVSETFGFTSGRFFSSYELNWDGHDNLSLHSQSSPCHHSLCSFNCEVRRPREAHSAEFSVPGTCLHWALGMSSWMSATLFPTKSFYRDGCELIHVSATCASVHRWICEIGNFELSNACFANLVSNTATPNSNLGIESLVSGATLVFDMRKDEVDPAVSDVDLM